MTTETIKIQNRYFVSKPNRDTRLFARYILSTKPASFLDLGTGTGYIAIFLQKNHIKVHASDIDDSAVELTRYNAGLNYADFPVVQSDLFSSIKEKFHTIGFNVPLSFEKNRVMIFLKSLFRGIPLFQNYIVWHIPKHILEQRKLLISKFIQQGMPFLEEGGSFFLLIYGLERPLLQNLCLAHHLTLEQHQDDYLRKRNIIFVRLQRKGENRE